MPPTSLYAPQVRLVDLATGKVIGATRASGTAAAAVVPDVISTRVTLTNTGVGQLSITLNNQRFFDGKPGAPPWKYNAFRTPSERSRELADGLGDLGFGQLVRVDVRYGDGTWIKLIVAQINDLQYAFSATGGAQVEVIGEDLLCRLKIKPRGNVNHDHKQEEQIVQAVIDKVFGDAADRPALALLGNAAAQQGRTVPQDSVTHTSTVTYFQFLSDLADRLDYELFVDFADVRAGRDGNRVVAAAPGPIALARELEIAFQPARCQSPPQGERQNGLDPAADAELFDLHYALRWGLNLLEFTPRFKVFDTPTGASVAGTSAPGRARITQTLTAAEITQLMTAELPDSPSYSGVSMRDAVAARRQYFTDAGEAGESAESTPAANLDAPRLKLKAGAQFLKKAREFMTADGKTIGLPRLRPGHYLDVVGLRPPFDGYYYVTKTVHTIDGSGYKTAFSVRRPGMQPPEQYLSAAPT